MGSSQAQPAVQTIQISVQLDDKGNPEFTYIPSVKRAYPGDKVQWISNGMPFSIAFKKHTPSVKFEAHGSRDSNTPGQFTSTPLDIRADARGHYHYVVVVEIEETMYIDAACPEIIITEA